MVVEAFKMTTHRMGTCSLNSTNPTSEDGHLVIVETDMTQEMQQAALDVCLAAIEEFKEGGRIQFQEIATRIKREFDNRYNPSWHCVVGSNYTACITQELMHYAYLSEGHDLHVLLFK